MKASRLPPPCRLLGLLGLLLGSAVGSVADSAFPLVEGLGTHSRPVTTRSPEAQRYFDQGLRFLFGFNHSSAIKSFAEAARLDPDCAMAHWGIALANGPHINFPMVPPPAAEAAWKELGLARQAAAKATPVEQALIEALGHRYANPQPEDRSGLDRAYADAMRTVWQRFPQDADVGAFFAEAMMDLRPWDQWTREGQAQPGTDEIIATLDAVLRLDIIHPFANHLYIHALEASPHPEKAIPAADRLLGLQPGLPHNVHMPSHIYIRVGRWQQAVDSNLLAVEAQHKFHARIGPPQGLLPVYNAHNEHMLAYAAMMTGQSALAISHIRAMATCFPADFLQNYAFVADGFMPMPLEVLVRFGHWDEVLAEPESYPATMPFSRAFRRAARGISFAAKGEPKSARLEEAAYAAAAKLVPADARVGQNSAGAVLAVITPMLSGEISLREGRTEEGLALLRTAVNAEDALNYSEPPDWLIPVRHSLGAALVRLGRPAEAEQAYREDLAHLPEDGWALFGLGEALVLQHRMAEAAPVRARFQRVWAKADLEINSSCLCQPPPLAMQ